MPIKNLLEPILYVLDSDGNYIELGKIKEATFIEDTSSFCDYTDENLLHVPVINPTAEATFSVTWNPTADLIYLLVHGRLPSNNWRKMHNHPMKRKGKGRKKAKGLNYGNLH